MAVCPPRLMQLLLEQAFETIISSFLENRVGLVDTFLEEKLSAQLKKSLLKLHEQQQFKNAGIGSNARVTQDKLIRKDVIYWLDRAHDDVHENNFLDVMDAFVLYLNRTCYSGITGYEFHYAFYDKGSFYKRHLDQFKDDSKRAYSMIMYLNEEWEDKDGGQLCIYHPNETQTIAPTNGKCVFFKSSELEHEVLRSHQPRLSITGWLKTN